MRSPVVTAFAIAIGAVIVLGYFLPIPEIQSLRAVMVGWAVILAGMAALVAILNLIGVHWRKLTARRGGDRYSIIVVLAFLATVGAGIYLGPSDPNFQKVVTSIQLPVEMSLMALVALTLAFAGLRLAQRRRGLMAVVFLFSALVYLVIVSGVLLSAAGAPLVAEFLSFAQTLPVAGARGILLGLAIGSLIAGLRVLMGVDRPYSG